MTILLWLAWAYFYLTAVPLCLLLLVTVASAARAGIIRAIQRRPFRRTRVIAAPTAG